MMIDSSTEVVIGTAAPSLPARPQSPSLSLHFLRSSTNGEGGRWKKKEGLIRISPSLKCTEKQNAPKKRRFF